MSLIGLCFGISGLVGAHDFHGDRFYRVLDIAVNANNVRPTSVIVEECQIFADKSTACNIFNRKSTAVSWRGEQHDIAVLVLGNDSFYEITCPKRK